MPSFLFDLMKFAESTRIANKICWICANAERCPLDHECTTIKAVKKYHEVLDYDNTDHGDDKA